MKPMPTRGRVFVRPVVEEKSTHGILLGSAKELPTKGVITALGLPPITHSEIEVPMTVVVGDNVLFDKFKGSDIEVGNETLMVMDEEDIIGILD